MRKSANTLSTSPKHEVLNFRTDRQLVERLDKLAASERRTRASLMERLLIDATDMERPVRIIDLVVRMLYAEVERRGEDSVQAEYFRGQLHGAKWMLAELRGNAIKDRVCHEVRKRTGKPFPHIVPLAPDGKRYGFDLDADLDEIN
jgi:hypothetical protein